MAITWLGAARGGEFATGGQHVAAGAVLSGLDVFPAEIDHLGIGFEVQGWGIHVAADDIVMAEGFNLGLDGRFRPEEPKVLSRPIQVLTKLYVIGNVLVLVGTGVHQDRRHAQFLDFLVNLFHIRGK